MISTAYLRQRLRYEPETGALIWLARPGSDFPTRSWNRRFSGNRAGTVARDGRRYVTIDAHHYRTARVIWQITTEVAPRLGVDHKDGDPSNDRWSNLRLATQSENMGNQKRHSDGVSGLKGVTQHKCGLYRARIGVRHIGYFDTKEEAHTAYCAAARETFGDFARTE